MHFSTRIKDKKIWVHGPQALTEHHTSLKHDSNTGSKIILNSMMVLTLSQASIYVVQRRCVIRCFQSTGRFLKSAGVLWCKYF